MIYRMHSFFFFKDFIYLFLERGEGKEKERERIIYVWLPLVCADPHWGPGPQPRHVPWLGIELETLWFTGLCSIHWATPARAECIAAKVYSNFCFTLPSCHNGKDWNTQNSKIMTWNKSLYSSPEYPMWWVVRILCTIDDIDFQIVFWEVKQSLIS